MNLLYKYACFASEYAEKELSSKQQRNLAGALGAGAAGVGSLAYAGRNAWKSKKATQEADMIDELNSIFKGFAKLKLDNPSAVNEMLEQPELLRKYAKNSALRAKLATGAGVGLLAGSAYLASKKQKNQEDLK